MKEELKSKYIVWEDHGYEGWHPYGYDSLKEALAHDSYGSRKVITSGPIDFEVTEKT